MFVLGIQLLSILVCVCNAVGVTPQSKIDPQLQHTLNTNGIGNIVIGFTQDIEHVFQNVKSREYTTREERIIALKTELEAVRDLSQQTLLEILNVNGIQYRSFWINNRVYIRNANASLVNSIVAIPEVSYIRGEQVVSLSSVEADINITKSSAWGIDKIEAPEAWSAGYNGGGVVVAEISTGARYTHEILSANYRSYYGWFDPYGSGSPTLVDEDGIGTHVLGIMVGADGIGVAPGANWIACRGCKDDECTEANLVACGQWVACPTDPSGQSPDCTKAPNIVASTWSFSGGSTWYDAIIRAWHAANIIPFFPIGDRGPSCGTTTYPGESRDVIAVRCTTQGDHICHLSSRGPSAAGAVKPDITAPGRSIKSAGITSDNAYDIMSGTSMSTGHAAGTATLVLSYNIGLTFTTVQNIIYNSADRDLGQADACGGIPLNRFPNNVYGFGRVNAKRALAAIK